MIGRGLMAVGMCVWCGMLAGAGDGAAGTVGRSVRADGVIMVEGKPFFPLGIYHDSLDADYYGEKFLRDLDVIADAGFNLVHVSMDFSQDGESPETSTAGKAAALAQKRGMYLAVAVYLKGLEAVVKEQAKWPAILMASLGDDFNSDAKGKFVGPAKIPPERMKKLSEAVKKLAPGMITYSSGSSYKGAKLGGYEEAPDVIGVQCYPIGDGSQSEKNELEAMEDVVGNYWIASGTQANDAMIVNPQAFAWPGKRWPRPEEMRLQAWISVMRGAKGLIWYSYLSGDGKKKKTLPEACPEDWKELKTLVGELKGKVEYFTEGHYTMIDNPKDAAFDDGQGTWHAGYWTLGKKKLVVAVNTHRTKGMEVDLNVGGGGKMLRVLEEGRYPAKLEWVGGHWKGMIGAGAVEVGVVEE